MIPYLSFSVWFTSLSMIISRSIHVIVNGIISFMMFYDFKTLTNILLPIFPSSFSSPGCLWRLPRALWPFTDRATLHSGSRATRVSPSFALPSAICDSRALDSITDKAPAGPIADKRPHRCSINRSLLRNEFTMLHKPGSYQNRG